MYYLFSVQRRNPHFPLVPFPCATGYVTFVKKSWVFASFYVKFLDIAFSTLSRLDDKEKKKTEEAKKKKRGKRRTHGLLHILLKIRAHNSPRCAYRRGTKREGREKEGRDDTVSLTHEVIVYKNSLVRYRQRQADTRSPSIAAPSNEALSAEVPLKKKKKKRKRFRDKLGYVFFLCRTTFLRCGYQSGHVGREWSGTQKTAIFACLSPAKKKCHCLRDTRYRATRNKWRRLCSLGRHWYRNEVLHFESDISALHLSPVINTIIWNYCWSQSPMLNYVLRGTCASYKRESGAKYRNMFYNCAHLCRSAI